MDRIEVESNASTYEMSYEEPSPEEIEEEEQRHKKVLSVYAAARQKSPRDLDEKKFSRLLDTEELEKASYRELCKYEEQLLKVKNKAFFSKRS